MARKEQQLFHSEREQQVREKGTKVVPFRKGHQFREKEHQLCEKGTTVARKGIEVVPFKKRTTFV
jgi:hypothetical protein